MAYEFVIKNGLISQGNSLIKGNLNVIGTITGSLTGSTYGTSSWAVTASYALSSNNLSSGSSYNINVAWASSSMSSSYSTTAATSSFPWFVTGSNVAYMGGNVGINTTTPAYTLQINGSLGAKTKSFIIDHPTKNGKQLCYGSLESPYYGIRLTGRGKVGKITKKGIKVELPEYISKLIREECVNIQLTPIKCSKVFYVNEINIDNNCFYVKYNGKATSKKYEFFWDFTAIRSDVEELITEI